MSNPFTSKVSKVYDERTKIEKELCKLHESIDDAIHEKARRVRVESLVTKCKDLLENCITKNDSLMGLAAKTEQAEKLQSELEEWLAVVNKRHDEYMENARDYIDSKKFKKGLSNIPQILVCWYLFEGFNHSQERLYFSKN